VDGVDRHAVTRPATWSGAVADLTEVLPSLDLRVVARVDGANLFLVLAEPPAVPSWTFAVSMPAGAQLRPDGRGGVEAVDADGRVRASIASPWAVDSTPDKLTGSGRMTTNLHYELGTALDGRATLTVVIDDRDWLADAVYPIYVDPSTTFDYGDGAYGDTFLNEGNPNFNYGSYQRPDSPYFYELWLGESPSNATYVNHALVKFDLSSLAGKQVDSAELQFRPYHAYYDAPTARGVWVRRVGTSWTESGVTWNTRPTKTSNANTDICAESTALSCFVDVTYWTRTFLDGLNTNWGFWVDTDGNNYTYWKRLISGEQAHSTSPRLYVEYHDPVTIVYPASGQTSSRTLSWAPDPVWGQQAYQVDVSTTSSFSSFVAQSGTQAGAATSWAVPIGTGLTAGTTYYWRVRTQATNGAWSVWTTGQFTWDPGLLGLQDHHRYESWDLGGGDTLAVDASTLNAVVSHPIVSLPYRGGSLDLALTYNAQDPDDAGFGRGWRFSHGRRLAVNATTGAVTFIDADGARHTFTNPSGSGTLTYTRPATLYATLTRNTTASPDRFTLTYRDGSKDTFDELATNTGYLVREEDRHANGINLTYSGTTLTTLTDPAGRTVGLTWASGHVTQIVDWANVSGGIVQTSGSGNRTHRFFYSGSTLTGWAGPLNTSATCPTGGSHLVCLTYDAKGYVWKITKTQTYTTFTTGTLGTATRPVTTEIDQAGTGEVRGVRDAEQFDGTDPANTFNRTAGLVEVVRRGSPDATTRHAVPAATDPYARITSVKRKLGASWIEQLTAYNATYPIEPATVTENNGGLLSTPARTTSYTYLASSLGLLQKVVEPLTATDDRWTEYVYNANNDVTQQTVSLEGLAPPNTPVPPTVTRYCYEATCSTSGTGLHLVKRIGNFVDGNAGGANGQYEDVTTSFAYDAYGQLTRETRSNYSGSTLVDSRAIGYEYDANGNLTKEIVNHVDGTVANPGDDITPNATTNARTDLTTTRAYDTAGNRVSSADPRRAIELAEGTTLNADDYVARTTFDALNRPINERRPTTPGVGDCSPSPGCRESATAYDELSLTRTVTDPNGRVTATEYDRGGRATRAFEDTDGAGSTAATQTSAATYDARGQVLTTKDQRQVATAGLGWTANTYDELGRLTDSIEASNSSPDVASTTRSVYDALDRRTSEEIGYGTTSAQKTTYTYDLGGRATAVDDEFTARPRRSTTAISRPRPSGARTAAAALRRGPR
jgi:hypothetical protein